MEKISYKQYRDFLNQIDPKNNCPIQTLTGKTIIPFATSGGSGMGKTTIIAVCTGKGDKEGANQAFMSALVMTIVVSVLLTVIGMAFARDIVMLCGGKNLSREMVDIAEQY